MYIDNDKCMVHIHTNCVQISPHIKATAPESVLSGITLLLTIASEVNIPKVLNHVTYKDILMLVRYTGT